MQRLSTRTHGFLDYGSAVAMLAAPAALKLPARSSAMLRAAGGGALVYSLLTDYELGVLRKLPVRAHLALDAASGAGLAAAPFLLGKAATPRVWAAHLVAGLGEIAAAALTDPARRVEPAPAGSGTAGPTGRSLHQAGARFGTPAPPETPGPSVPPIAVPESETERAEWADRGVPNREWVEEHAADPVEAMVLEAEAAAAAEAAAIGGPAPDDGDGDPAMAPVYQAGGGVAEGFELAEQDLIEEATLGDVHGNPLRDAFTPEVESDRAGAVYGDADEIESTELVRDRNEDDPGSDPGSGPRLSAER